MPLAQKPSILRSSSALAAVTPKIHAGCQRARHRRDRHAVADEIDTGFDEQAAQSISTHGAAPMLRPLTPAMSPRVTPRSLRMTRNQYMPWACAQMSFTPWP